jgi:hypothetical protein
MGMMVCSQVHGSVETELGSQWGAVVPRGGGQCGNRLQLQLQLQRRSRRSIWPRRAAVRHLSYNGCVEWSMNGFMPAVGRRIVRGIPCEWNVGVE